MRRGAHPVVEHPLGRDGRQVHGSGIEEPLDPGDSSSLEAGGHKIADGEAVKVGEKFGLRITSIHLPEERYKPVGQ